MLDPITVSYKTGINKQILKISLSGDSSKTCHSNIFVFCEIVGKAYEEGTWELDGHFTFHLSKDDVKEKFITFRDPCYELSI